MQLALTGISGVISYRLITAAYVRRGYAVRLEKLTPSLTDKATLHQAVAPPTATHMLS